MRAIGHDLVADLDGLADAGRLNKVVGQLADGGGGNGALVLGPFGREVLERLAHLHEGRGGVLAVNLEAAGQRGIGDGGIVENLGLSVGQVPNHGLVGLGVAQEPTVVADQIGAVRTVLQELLVVLLDLVEQHVVEGEQESVVAAGADGDPLALARLHRAAGVDDHGAHAALAGLVHLVALARGVAVVLPDMAADVNEQVAVTHVEADARKHAEHHLRGVVDRADRAVGLEHLAVAEDSGELRGERVVAAGKTGHEQQLAGVVVAHLLELLRDGVERLVPADLDPAGVDAEPLLGIGALHRRLHAVRVVRMGHLAVAAVAQRAEVARIVRVALYVGDHAVGDGDDGPALARFAHAAQAVQLLHLGCRAIGFGHGPLAEQGSPGANPRKGSRCSDALQKAPSGQSLLHRCFSSPCIITPRCNYTVV